MQHIPMILTRPEGANAALLSQMPAALQDRLTVVESPLIDIRSLPVATELVPDEGAIFTSAHAVHFGPEGMGRPAFCVGQKTTLEAQMKGWTAVQAGLDAAGLIETLTTRRPTVALCHLSGVHQRGDIAKHLSQAGLNVRQKVIYDQFLMPLSQAAIDVLSAKTPVIVPLFSPRTAAHFAKWARKARALYLVFMSDAVAQAWPGAAGETVTTASQPDARSMVEAIEKTVRTISLG